MIVPDKDFREGDDASRFTATDYRAIAEYTEAMGAMSVVSPLQLSNGGSNRIISLRLIRGFWATVSGPANPYGFTELYRNGSFDLVPNDGGYTGSPTPTVGDLTAYEVNGRVALDGTVQWLEPGYDNDYRFQDIAIGTAHGPPPCPLTIHLRSCDGTPISGATVRVDDLPLHSPPRTPIIGTTDASGNYTLPDTITLAGRGVYYITWDGVTAGPFLIPGESVYFCDHPLDYCYDKAVIHVTVTGDPTATIDPAVYPFTLGPTVSGVTDLTYKRIRLCSMPSLLPATIEIGASPNVPGYLDNCATVTAICNDDINITIALYYYATCYKLGNALDPSCYCNDKGCQFGPGPNGRGLLSRSYQVRFTSIPYSIAGVTTNPNYFADDEGGWITLSDAGDGTWSSGCRDGAGNFLSFRNLGGGNVTCQLNRAEPYEFNRVEYGSTKIVMSCRAITYTRYGTTDCTVAATCDHLYQGGPTTSNAGVGNCSCDLQDDGSICGPCFQRAFIDPGAPGAGVSGQLCIPCDFTIFGQNAFPGINDFSIEIRETC